MGIPVPVECSVAGHLQFTVSLFVLVQRSPRVFHSCCFSTYVMWIRNLQQVAETSPLFHIMSTLLGITVKEFEHFFPNVVKSLSIPLPHFFHQPKLPKLKPKTCWLRVFGHLCDIT